MIIAKVIRYYFVFTMAIVVAGLAVFNSNIESYFIGLFVGGGESSGIEALMKASAFDFEAGSGVEGVDYALRFVGDSESAYAIPGEEDVKVMDVEFIKSGEGKVNDLVLKIGGVDGEMIKKAYLKDGDEILDKVGVKDDMLIFGGVGYAFEGEGMLGVYLDLSEDLKFGNRIRLDGVLGDTVVRGKSLSIVRSRGF
ncbi:MAG: hypothetical protein V1679_03055 [Candidatus Peregrinibacteria bacterium]